MTVSKLIRGLFVNEKKTQYGSLMNVDIIAKDFIEFVKENTNEKGYCKITILKAKEGGKNTHYAVLNDWKPTAQTGDKINNVSVGGNDDDLPF